MSSWLAISSAYGIGLQMERTTKRLSSESPRRARVRVVAAFPLGAPRSLSSIKGIKGISRQEKFRELLSAAKLNKIVGHTS
jgi:hypothetical protein